MRLLISVYGFGTQSKIREVKYAIGIVLCPHQEVGEILFVCKSLEARTRVESVAAESPPNIRAEPASTAPVVRAVASQKNERDHDVLAHQPAKKTRVCLAVPEFGLLRD